MLSGIKPPTVTEKHARELLSPKLVDRLIYAAKNFPEMGWLKILPKEGKEVRKTYIVYESLERAFQRIRAGEYLEVIGKGQVTCSLGKGLVLVRDRSHVVLFQPACRATACRATVG